MKAMLNSSMVTSIPEACALLLYKNLHLPVEEEDEFPETKTGLSGTMADTSTQSLMLQQLRQMNQLMLQQQQASSTSPQGHINVVAPARAQTTGTTAPQRSGTGSPPLGTLRIRLGPDTRTTEGTIVCGRCERRGCSRETCPRATGHFSRCNELGHYSMECNIPKPQANNRYAERRPPECLLCGRGAT